MSEENKVVENIPEHFFQLDVTIHFLRERVRELEGDLVEAKCERDYFKNELEEARQRIAKARAILTGITYANMPVVVREALDALEGK